MRDPWKIRLPTFLHWEVSLSIYPTGIPIGGYYVFPTRINAVLFRGKFYEKSVRDTPVFLFIAHNGSLCIRD